LINRLCYIVRLATLFRALGSSGDTDGSRYSGEQHFIRLHVARASSIKLIQMLKIKQMNEI
ncbi:hypothetical protein, partial [Parashewanella spongiae]|uniref:hypothetical protein n=1 Tax=Parashewanella spongiae TaxID=342950 RepID=UPI001A9EEF41